MVQPSFQNTPPFGVSNIPVMGGVSGAFGVVDPSRPSVLEILFEILISSIVVHLQQVVHLLVPQPLLKGLSMGTCQDAARTQGGNPPGHPVGTRGLPTRIVVAAIPARSSVEVPNHVVSVFLPVQVRSPVAVPN